MPTPQYGDYQWDIYGDGLPQDSKTKWAHSLGARQSR